MTGHRISRINEDFRRELTEVMRTLKDPRISGLVTVVRTEVTNDLSYAKVYISSIDGLSSAKNAVEGLKSASGFIKRELGMRLKLRKMPELRFIADNSIEYSAGILKKLDELNIKDDTEET